YAADHVVDLLQAMAQFRQCQPGLVKGQAKDRLDGAEASRHVEEDEGSEEAENQEADTKQQYSDLPDHYRSFLRSPDASRCCPSCTVVAAELNRLPDDPAASSPLEEHQQHQVDHRMQLSQGQPAAHPGKGEGLPDGHSQRAQP